MSAETRYYYVDAQNQAAGPIAMAGLLALRSAGTITDATLVVVEGGTEWVAFSTLKPTGEAVAIRSTPPEAVRGEGGAAAVGVTTPRGLGEGGVAAEPLWASQLSQKVDRLVSTMEKLIISLEKTRATTPPAPIMTPSTAPLHAEKINLNPVPKPGIASQVPPAPVARPAPLPAGIPVAAPRTISAPRPAVSTPLSPLAVPANAQKSGLPLPALGKPPGPAPVSTPAKGNIFSKFLKK